MPKRAMSTRRITASSALPAWSVVSEPSWPVLSALSMSTHSPPRTSPTTILSGRMRRAFFTRSLIVISPEPSMELSRASRRTTFGCASKRSSAESSIVTILSPSGISHESALSSVVLPEPVLPQPPPSAGRARPRRAGARTTAAAH